MDWFHPHQPIFIQRPIFFNLVYLHGCYRKSWFLQRCRYLRTYHFGVWDDSCWFWVWIPSWGRFVSIWRCPFWAFLSFFVHNHVQLSTQRSKFSTEEHLHKDKKRGGRNECVSSPFKITWVYISEALEKAYNTTAHAERIHRSPLSNQPLSVKVEDEQSSVKLIR